jgi:hypothetical protein
MEERKMSGHSNEDIFGHSESESPSARGPEASFWDSAGGKGQVLLDAVLLILAVVNIYWILSSRNQFTQTAQMQAEQLNLLMRRLDSSDERFARLSAELQVTTDKLGLTTEELSRARAVETSIKKQQKQAVQQLNSAIAQKASADDMNKLQADASAKFDNLSGDLSKTRDALTDAKGELSGSIARTHDELVTLAHKTDRDYFEFNLPRKGARQKIGGVAVELVKTNPKKNQFTVNLYFDDKRTQQKDKAYMEPVLFYVQGAPSALEMVVNRVSKDHIAGYLSTPKGIFAGVPNVLNERPAS